MGHILRRGRHSLLGGGKVSCLYSCSSAHHAEMSMCSQAPDPGGVPLHQGQGCVYLCFPGAPHSTERYPQDVFGELKETKRSILLQSALPSMPPATEIPHDHPCQARVPSPLGVFTCPTIASSLFFSDLRPSVALTVLLEEVTCVDGFLPTQNVQVLRIRTVVLHLCNDAHCAWARDSKCSLHLTHRCERLNRKSPGCPGHRQGTKLLHKHLMASGIRITSHRMSTNSWTLLL
ncbi:uncharacterized protein LOC122199208 [Panthera leo]|uniref:uncharacterized protein LOC122199208 n=1 Tax=Panthera leo TaxID=9689 RepID=UPI001C695F7D|nr:uncharacterized protein LOC122199208 [Panthera leo]